MHAISPDVHQALDLIEQIEARGGPPRKRRAQLERVRATVQAAAAAPAGDLSGTDDRDELGWWPIVIWLGRLLAVTGAGGAVYVGWQALGTAEKVAKTLIWAGGVWVVWQLYKYR